MVIGVGQVFGDLARRVVRIGVDLDRGVEVGFGVGHLDPPNG